MFLNVEFLYVHLYYLFKIISIVKCQSIEINNPEDEGQC